MTKQTPSANVQGPPGLRIGPWGFFSHWSFVIRHFSIGVALLICISTAHPRINVVTLPDRDTVQLTIYNSVDLTLVKETRHLMERGLCVRGK